MNILRADVAGTTHGSSRDPVRERPCGGDENLDPGLIEASQAVQSRGGQPGEHRARPSRQDGDPAGLFLANTAIVSDDHPPARLLPPATAQLPAKRGPA